MAKSGTTETKKPRISVLERRLQNPFGEPSQAIRFKLPNIEGRWVNDKTRPGNVHRAKELGWEPVTLDMIEDLDTVGFHTISVGNQIVRGERGEEVLMWMPATEFKQIQFAKTKKNLEAMRDTGKQTQDMLQAAAKQFGSEAADYLNPESGPTGFVRDKVERINYNPQDGE